jgi:hypothetical protein
VAKRTRASRSARRPGGQGPNRTTKKASEGTPASSGDPDVSPAEDIGASHSEVEVDEVAAAAVAAVTTSQPVQPPTQQPTAGRRARRRASRSARRTSQDDLAARAGAETVWVREDLRRIGVVSLVLIAALAVAYVLFGVMDVLNLY